MINKNFYRKTNDKKILHKVGKQWKVISVALLLAIGGGAAVAANANADANVSSATQAEVNELETKPNVVSAVSAAPSSAAKSSSASAKPASAISYLSGYNGSAASYHAKVGNEQALYNANNATVQSYVNSLNNVYPSQTSSLTNNYNSAKDQYNNDSSLAGSYSAIAATSGYSSEVSSLASKAGLTVSAFIDQVGTKASSYTSNVSANSKDASQMSEINSYAQLISAISGNSALREDYKAKSTSASAESTVANATSKAVSNVYQNAINNSKNDATLYNNARIASTENQNEENTALIESGMDSNTTSVIASAMGYTNSSVTSSITSAFASAHADSIVSAVAATQNISYSGVTSSGSTFTSPFNFLSGASELSAKAGVSVTQDNLYQLLSNTAVEERFGSKQALYNSEMASGSSAMSKDADLVSSASAASQSANNVSLSASNVAHINGILASATDLTAIFGSATPVSISANAYATAAANYLNSLADNNTVITTDGSYVAGVLPVSGATTSFGTHDGQQVVAYMNGSVQIIGQTADAFKYAPFERDYIQYLLSNAASAANAAHGTSATATDMATSFADEYGNAKTALDDAYSGLTANNASAIATAYANHSNDASAMASNALEIAGGTDGNQIKGNTSASSVASELMSAIAQNTTDNNKAKGLSEAFTATGANNDISQANVNDIKSAGFIHDTLSAATDLLSGFIQGGKISSTANSYDGLLSAASYTVAGDVESVASNYNVTSGTSILASSANSYANNYANASSESASYSASTDENVTLASSYATSYSNDAENDATSVSATKNSLDDFYATHADDKYTKASSVAASAGSAASDAKALAHANGMHVFNYGPKFVTVTKNAQLHSATDYTSANVIGKAVTGDQFQVVGVGFAANGATRFLVNTKNGNKAYLTGNTGYVEPTYLQAANGVSVTFTKDAKVYTDKAATKATGQTIKAGTTLPNVNIVSLDNAYIGSSRIATPSGNYVTANTKYVSLNGNEANAASGDTDTTAQNNGVVNYWD